MLDLSGKKGKLLFNNRSKDHFILRLYAINAERKRESSNICLELNLEL